MKIKGMALALAALMLFAALPAYASDRAETSVVIVELDEGADPYTAAALSGGELLYVYKNVMNGFSVRISEERLPALAALVCVKEVYASVSREPASATSVSKTAVSARAEISPRAGLETALRGEGMTVAVIDTSFDVTHPLFTLSEGTETAFDRDFINKYEKTRLSTANRFSSSGASGYVSEKIPFAYDYVGKDTNVYSNDSHGTHVAGIIAANAAGSLTGDGFDGLAPEAQLVLMKARGDSSDSYFEDYAILAALDDAAELGVDAVNMSFGSPAAFDDLSMLGVDYNQIFKVLRAKGIYVVAAAGNEGSFGAGSGYSGLYGVADPLASAPDTAVLSSPAASADSISAASMNGGLVGYDQSLVTPDGGAISFYDASIPRFTERFSSRTLRYKYIGGVAGEKDFEGVDLDGCVALVNRGEITFVEKLDNCMKAGALGMIVINVEGADPVTMLVEEGQLPAVMISYEDGELLKKNETDGKNRVTVVSGEFRTAVNPKSGALSDFTSWGPTTTLALKPDVTAPGGLVYSTANGGGGTVMSGTSMASPYVCGAVLLMMQSRRLAGAEKSEDGENVRNALMSSAAPLTDAGTELEYSPRAQGAGRVQIDSALTSDTLLYAEDGLCRVNLGDGLGRTFTVSFTVENLSDKEKTYGLTATIASDDAYYSEEAGEYFVSGEPRAFSASGIYLEGSAKNLNRYNKRGTAVTVSVPAGGKKTLTLNVKGDSEELSAQSAIFKNGFFLEGFVYLSDGERRYSIPYMGFEGDWTAAPAISADPLYFMPEAASIIIAKNKFLPYMLGYNIFDEKSAYIPALAAVSPNGDGAGDYIGIKLALLRNLSHLELTIENDRGETICSYDDTQFLKAYVVSDSEPCHYELYTVWNGVSPDNSEYTLPDGQYYMKLFAKPEAGGEYQTLTIPFAIDTVRPTLDGCRVVKEGGKTYADVTVSDDRAVSAVRLYEGSSGDKDELYDKLAAVEYTAERASTVRFDITGLEGLRYLYVDITDYAMNVRTDRIYLGGND